MQSKQKKDLSIEVLLSLGVLKINKNIFLGKLIFENIEKDH
jgi:hypothetical protein